MTLAHALGNFLLSEWLWSVTLGIYQAPIAVIYMFVLICLFMRMRIYSALLVSVLCVMLSWLIYSLFVVGILIYLLNYEYTLAQLEQYPHTISFFVPLSLAVIYSLIQFLLIQKIPSRLISSYGRLVVIMCIANFAAAVVVYVLLPKVLRSF